MNLDIQLSDFLSPGDPCELIKKLVMELDTGAIESTYSDIGQRGYHPKLLLSVIFYGYTQGLRSGRKLSEACKTDIRYIYLSQGYRPSKSTFNDFRKNHYESFEDLFKQVVEKCIDLGLAQPQGPSFGDGSKIRANASSKRSKTKGTYEKWLAHLQADIVDLQAQLASDDDESQKEQKENLLAKSVLEDKLRDRLERFESDSDQQKINATDPDAHFMKGKKGNKDTYYNPQIVVDANQFILHNHVCGSSSDRRQLKDCLEGFKRNTGHYPKDSTWDCGYSSFENEQYLQQRQIQAYIPDQEFGKSFKDQPFHHHHFQYDPKKDQYLCPKGKPLIFKRHKNYNGYQYRVYQGTACGHCPFRTKCTKAQARTIHREQRQPLRDQMYSRLLTSKGQQLYKMRKHRVEPVFGHLKHNLGYTQFLLRTLPKVQAEFNIMCIAYNLAKMVLWQTKKPFLTLIKHLRDTVGKNSDRLYSIVNELCASFFRCFIYKLFYNASR